jgi:hypothetical protein
MLHIIYRYIQSTPGTTQLEARQLWTLLQMQTWTIRPNPHPNRNWCVIYSSFENNQSILTPKH